MAFAGGRRHYWAEVAPVCICWYIEGHTDKLVAIVWEIKYRVDERTAGRFTAFVEDERFTKSITTTIRCCWENYNYVSSETDQSIFHPNAIPSIPREPYAASKRKKRKCLKLPVSMHVYQSNSTWRKTNKIHKRKEPRLGKPPHPTQHTSPCIDSPTTQEKV